ncbi:MAG: DUF2927 domain-containing protein [Rhodobacteraceae bacterium]|nr:DUF2927 domain-containing protein [Paracoccaceae bacterium]
MRWRTISAVLALAACADPVPAPPALSFDLGTYYAATEAEIRAQGGLRTEYAPTDAPFTKDDLARNFMRIALFDEYQTVNGHFVVGESPSNLRRYDRPVRVRVVNGASTPESDAQFNTAAVAQYTRRLARITGLDMRYANDGERANMVVFFLSRAEQPRMAQQLGRYVGAPPREVEAAFANTQVDVLCAAFSLSNERTPDSYDSSVILIKSEHSIAQRNACVMEEMAQALGLTNDSRAARPSIFNDDEEFAALTHHDELLLRILYDPRLHSGMPPNVVRPLLSTIINDIW